MGRRAAQQPRQTRACRRRTRLQAARLRFFQDLAQLIPHELTHRVAVGDLPTSSASAVQLVPAKLSVLRRHPL